MKKRKLALGLILALGALFAGGMNWFIAARNALGDRDSLKAQKAASHKAYGTPLDDGKRRTGGSEMGITPAQQAKIDALITKVRENDANPDPKKRMNYQEFTRQMDAILTPEQAAKMHGDDKGTGQRS